MDLFKVIITDNLNRYYKPQGLVTMAMSKASATAVAELLNNHLPVYTQCAIAVPANQPLKLESHYDLIDEVMPYDYWLTLTGAAALPDHVAKYWYETTILKQPSIVAEFEGTIVHHYERNTDLIILPSGRSTGPSMWPYDSKLKITITKE